VGKEDDDLKPVCSCPLCREAFLEPSPAPRVMREWGAIIRGIFAVSTPEIVCDQLIAVLREHSQDNSDLLALLADMLDPAGKTTWRLKLQRRPGRPSRLTQADAVGLWLEYEDRLQELESENRASPAKTARGELAAEYKMTDEEVRAIIDRVQGKRVRTKRTGRK
jgi:hypothetical protein